MRWLGKAALVGVAGIGALGLALWRRDIPYKVLTDRYGDPSSRFLPMPDGVRLHLRDLGRKDGPVLVCLHGYSASSLDWLPWAERLGRRYRLILIDLPGHGLTAAPDGYAPGAAAMVSSVAAVLTALDLHRVVLVGNSMGGQVAWHCAIDHPSRVAGLVLVAAIGWADTAKAAPPSLAFRLLGSAAGRFVLRHLDLTPLVRRGLRTAFGDRRLATAEVVRRYADLARAPGHRAILTTLQLGGGDAVRLSALTTLRHPTLVMAGEDDRLVPVGDARRFAQVIPHATLVLYPGVGHVPMQQIPDRSAADLDAWLRRLSP